MKGAACPRCGKPTQLDAGNSFRPFCSERCQKIDFGDWAAERYRVPLEDQTPPDANDEPKDPLN